MKKTTSEGRALNMNNSDGESGHEGTSGDTGSHQGAP